ncbi:lipocalin family protein [Cytophagaceae bacterium DM2B3-1]|uniref:Lipocalin family protein n=1 Tax=Xanthocytophaga flava TaxID=3048013 RepID=A0ABT7CEG2_9BACT|nr:lipocalin family protein [Xanthocytophaga flavus]MDJ1468948.1 lipocalin family protein [Xanthocytophaga flavus]MDJ1492122.1 lipocalin family protein [Xanthocytophaga flavus]
MQKHNYNFLLLMVLVAFSIVFTGCKKDDEPSVSTKAQLTTGTWKVVNYQYVTSINGVEADKETETPEGTETYEFKSDGTVTMVSTDSDGNKDTETAKWELSNGDKTLTVTFSDDEKQVVIIKEISSNKLVVTGSESSSSNGITYKFEYTTTFSK